MFCGLITLTGHALRRNVLSHIVEIKTEVRDAGGVRAACDRLRLEPPVDGKTRLFSREAEGSLFGCGTGVIRWCFRRRRQKLSTTTTVDAGVISRGSISFCRRMPLSRRTSRLGGYFSDPSLHPLQVRIVE